MPYYISQQPMNPVTRALAAVIAALAFIGALFFGMVILAVVFGLGLLFWIGFRLRMWWLMRQAPTRTDSATQRPSTSDVIDAEYTVVSKKQDP